MESTYRKISYDPQVGVFLEVLIRSGKKSDAETIVRRIKRFSLNTEEQPEIFHLYSNPDGYEFFIQAHELEGIDFPFSYRVLFFISAKKIYVASIARCHQS